MEPKLLGEMVGSKPGTGKTEDAPGIFWCQKISKCSKPDRGMLKGHRSQVEGAKAGTTHILISEQQYI